MPSDTSKSSLITSDILVSTSLVVDISIFPYKGVQRGADARGQTEAGGLALEIVVVAGSSRRAGTGDSSGSRKQHEYRGLPGVEVMFRTSDSEIKQKQEG